MPSASHLGKLLLQGNFPLMNFSSEGRERELPCGRTHAQPLEFPSNCGLIETGPLVFPGPISSLKPKDWFQKVALYPNREENQPQRQAGDSASAARQDLSSNSPFSDAHSIFILLLGRGLSRSYDTGS